jgi:hypothetical protein
MQTDGILETLPEWLREHDPPPETENLALVLALAWQSGVDISPRLVLACVARRLEALRGEEQSDEERYLLLSVPFLALGVGSSKLVALTLGWSRPMAWLAVIARRLLLRGPTKLQRLRFD